MAILLIDKLAIVLISAMADQVIDTNTLYKGYIVRRILEISRKKDTFLKKGSIVVVVAKINFLFF
jgi:hypothetical protein